MPRLALLLASLLLATSIHAQAPDSISFQGHLTDNLGQPIDSTGWSITFNLYKGGSSVWSETQSVDIVDGVFNVYLGAVEPLDTVAFNKPIDLGVTLSGQPEISPRTPLAAVAYARALPGLYTFYTEGNRGYNIVGGASNNYVGAGVVGATIGGGGGTSGISEYPNSVTGNGGTVSGGLNNQVQGPDAAIGGGWGNIAQGFRATVSGGFKNRALDDRTTIGGGQENWTTGQNATIGGGYNNRAGGANSTIPGGASNRASAGRTFAAGYRAQALHSGSFVWADSSSVTGNEFPTTGPDQFIVRAGGGVGLGTNSPSNQLTVNGDADFSGKVGIGFTTPNNELTVNGDADFSGKVGIGFTTPVTSIVIGGNDDALGGPTIVLSGNGVDQRESGRIRFIEDIETNLFNGMFIHYRGDQDALHIGRHTGINYANNNGELYGLTVESLTLDVGVQNAFPQHPLHVGTDTTNGNGAHVTEGGAWTNGSSRHFKTDFREIDRAILLEKLESVPITQWRYIGEDDVAHVGPVAEDFRAAFGLGHDERYITTVDADGVALAAIQGLYELVKEQQAEIERMRTAMERAGIE